MLDLLMFSYYDMVTAKSLYRNDLAHLRASRGQSEEANQAQQRVRQKPILASPVKNSLFSFSPRVYLHS